MTKKLTLFEEIVRKSKNFGDVDRFDIRSEHPFDERNIHPIIYDVSQSLFDNGHYAHSTLEAFKYIERKVKELSGSNEIGVRLMMHVFDQDRPKIQLTDLVSDTEIEEQRGYRFIFSGAFAAIRNPRAHDIISDTIDQCLDYLSLASFLLRRLEQAR